MSTVLGIQLREYVRDIAFHARFPDRQLIRNLFVGVSAGDSPQDVNFAGGEVVSGMTHQFYGNLLRDSPLSGMNCADGFEEFTMHLSF